MNLEGLAARAEIETLTVNRIKQRTLHLVLPGALFGSSGSCSVPN